MTQAIAVLDFEPEELTALKGWSWTEWEVEGLGQMANLFLSWNGEARFWLQSSREYPTHGISIEIGQEESDIAAARSDFVAGSGLGADSFLAIREGTDLWFARWDDAHRGGGRPPTATDRPKVLADGSGAAHGEP